MKRKILTDGNGSNQVHIEGMGEYIPLSEWEQLNTQLEKVQGQLENKTVLANQLKDNLTKAFERECALKEQIQQLLRLIYNNAEGYLCMGHRPDIEAMAQLAHSITGINSSQLRQPVTEGIR